MSFLKFLRRPRASTKSVLGADYQEEIIDKPTVPEPPPSISVYTEERLKEGLTFADHTLRNRKRIVSPITNHCLTLYKATVKAILLEEYADEDERKELLSNVLLCERDIYTRRFLRGPLDESELNLVHKLSRLRRFEFAARYGDYLSAVCDRLKVTARIEKTQYFEQLNGWERYWTDINSDINREASTWERWKVRDPTVLGEMVKTTLAVFNACNVMGLNFNRILQTIAMCADRNSLVHASVLRLVEQRKWHTLCQTLARDLIDLPVVTPNHLRGNIPIMQETIEAVIDTYFDRRGASPNDPEAWVVKPEAFERTAKYITEKTSKQEAILAERKRIEDQAAKKCAKLMAESSMVHHAAATLGQNAPTGELPRPKRPLSDSERNKRTAIYKKRKQAWDKLVRLQKQCHKNLLCYQDEYGNTEPPIDPEVWLDLPEDESSRPGSSSGADAIAGPSRSSACRPH